MPFVHTTNYSVDMQDVCFVVVCVVVVACVVAVAGDVAAAVSDSVAGFPACPLPG